MFTVQAASPCCHGEVRPETEVSGFTQELFKNITPLDKSKPQEQLTESVIHREGFATAWCMWALPPHHCKVGDSNHTLCVRDSASSPDIVRVFSHRGAVWRILELIGVNLWVQFPPALDWHTIQSVPLPCARYCLASPPACPRMLYWTSRRKNNGQVRF